MVDSAGYDLVDLYCRIDKHKAWNLIPIKF